MTQSRGGRNYVKKEPREIRCAVCRDVVFTTHPKQKTCLRKVCQDELRQRNFDSFINRQIAKVKEREAIRMAQKLIVDQAIKDALKLVEQQEVKKNHA